jgi:hypothetical protein
MLPLSILGYFNLYLNFLPKKPFTFDWTKL